MQNRQLLILNELPQIGFLSASCNASGMDGKSEKHGRVGLLSYEFSFSARKLLSILTQLTSGCTAYEKR